MTGKVKGREVEFSIQVEFQSAEITIIYTGVVEGEEMKGDVAVRGGGQEFKSTWTGKRQQARVHLLWPGSAFGWMVARLQGLTLADEVSWFEC